MAGRQSAAMDKVQKLIEGGMSAPEAARKIGIAQGGIYVKKWWKDLQKAKADQQKDQEQS